MTASSDTADVTALSDAYESALMRNDIDAMNDAFWHHADVLRFGIAEMQHGFDEVVAWRATAPPVSPERTMLSRHILALAEGVVAVDITFADPGVAGIGRQSQTWVRLDEGWRIMRAHVSVIPH